MCKYYNEALKKLPLNIEFWYIGSGCNRTCRVANMKASVASIHASMQPENAITKKYTHTHTYDFNIIIDSLK